VAVDQVLPDRHRVAPSADRLGDQLAEGLAAGARPGGGGQKTREKSVDTSPEMAGF
jgi:hypothetical protein